VPSFESQTGKLLGVLDAHVCFPCVLVLGASIRGYACVERFAELWELIMRWSLVTRGGRSAGLVHGVTTRFHRYCLFCCFLLSSYEWNGDAVDERRG
jgi:hypothetical protein